MKKTQKIKKSIRTSQKAATKGQKKALAEATVGVRVGVRAGVRAGKKVTPKISNERVGILGGAFNPVHAGHLNAALSVKNELKLDKVILIPAEKSPFREIVGPTSRERLKMIDLAIKAYEPELSSSDLEIERGGTSYTYETLRELGKTYKSKNIFFIMGADNFLEFPKWKNFDELLKLANFVVTTRPGTTLSSDETDLPKDLAVHVKKNEENVLKLKTGMTISFVELDDMDISSTEIRKRLRIDHDVKEFIPPNVLTYVEAQKFYKRTLPLVKDYRDFSIYCATKAIDRKALGVKLYDMTRKNGYADYSMICSATSTRHASSIADGILKSVKEDFGLTPISLEGTREGRWVLIDFGPVVIHVFEDAVRGTYNIEGLWKDNPQFQSEMTSLASSP